MDTNRCSDDGAIAAGSPEEKQADDVCEANAHLIAAAPDLYAALSAASGYLLNAKIDLETGAPKQTAIKTIEGGLKAVRAALAKASPPNVGRTPGATSNTDSSQEKTTEQP